MAAVGLEKKLHPWNSGRGRSIAELAGDRPGRRRQRQALREDLAGIERYHRRRAKIRHQAALGGEQEIVTGRRVQAEIAGGVCQRTEHEPDIGPDSHQ